MKDAGLLSKNESRMILFAIILFVLSYLASFITDSIVPSIFLLMAVLAIVAVGVSQILRTTGMMRKKGIRSVYKNEPYLFGNFVTFVGVLFGLIVVFGGYFWDTSGTVIPTGIGIIVISAVLGFLFKLRSPVYRRWLFVDFLFSFFRIFRFK